ncbi:hypothetical protein PC128_g8646 [Phytophthora cactorum]|nr:hypothetical protein PC120_g7120 [Phytophthora cactorum]KAG3195252.1 hypothetical protein PC128_g8646 [Phytophthora cactorum]
MRRRESQQARRQVFSIGEAISQLAVVASARECNDAFCGPQHVPHRLIANNNDAPAQDHALAESSGEKAPGDLAENSKVQHTVTLATYGAASTSSSDKAVQSIPSPR